MSSGWCWKHPLFRQILFSFTFLRWTVPPWTQSFIRSIFNSDLDSICYCHAWLSFNIVRALLYFSLVCNTIHFSVIFSWGTSSSTCILFSTITFLGITACFVVPFWSSPPNFYIVYVQDVISQWLLWSWLYFSINFWIIDQ